MFTIDRCRESFEKGIARANTCIGLYVAAKATVPVFMSCDDILRAAIVTCSSSFDLLHHELFRSAMAHNVRTNKIAVDYKIPVQSIHLPLDQAVVAIDRQIRDGNSHLSFLMPDKIASLYSPIIEEFWRKIALVLGEDDKMIKDRVRDLAKWRNRIVHESDINPDLAGIEEWIIVKSDVQSAVDDYRKFGVASCELIDQEIFA